MAGSLKSVQEKINQKMKDIPEYLHVSTMVTIGDQIAVDKEAGFLRGHGTLVDSQGNLSATVCGVVERVNKLVSVRSLRGRYVGETGDVVVGRITDVTNKRWRVDVNSQQDAQLMLSAVNLPGGIQRRRTAVDELNMRSLYTEGDVITAEVQSAHKDGSVAIHTRSLKYGKVEGGQLLKVPPQLVKRLKQHFHKLPEGIQIVLGCNGFVWVGIDPEINKGSDEDTSAVGNDGSTSGNVSNTVSQLEVKTLTVVPLLKREIICRVAMSIKALSSLGFPIFPDSIMIAFKLSMSLGLESRDLLDETFLLQLGLQEVKLRSEANNKSVVVE